MRYIGGASYDITDFDKFKADILRGYDTAVALCASICTRYGWDPMSKLPSGLYLISSHDEGRIAGLSSAHVDPTHIWNRFGLSMDTFRRAVKAALEGKSGVVSYEKDIRLYRIRRAWTDTDSQLGAYESLANAKEACPYGYSVFDDKGNEVFINNKKPSGTQASDFASLSESASAAKALKLIFETDNSGILPSVTAAQWILESGYGKTNLARISNNCFGMKVNLSGNTWDSVWDGKSQVTMPTWENYNGKDVTINAAFRAYPDIEHSILDHSAYLLGAMNGNKKRYAGLTKAKDYKEAITIIKNGGYATDPNYVSKICSIIERFGLNEYDAKVTPSKESVSKVTMYRVQLGLYDSLSNAKGRCTFVKNKTGFATAMLAVNDKYQAICGSFKTKGNATKRVKALKKFKIESVVKEVVIES